jgi:glutamate dehydrogenase
MRVSRGADGDAVDVLPIGERDGVAESVIHVEVDRRTEPEELEALCEDLRHALQDVRLAVDDWSPMSERARQLAGELRTDDAIGDRSEREEAAALLDWLDDGHFLFLATANTTWPARAETGLSSGGPRRARRAA